MIIAQTLRFNCIRQMEEMCRVESCKDEMNHRLVFQTREEEAYAARKKCKDIQRNSIKQ